MAGSHLPAEGNGYQSEDDVSYQRGLDDYHDPTGRIGGAAPARSALTLRLWLAAFGFLACAMLTLVAAIEGIRWLSAVAAVFAAVAVVDFVWVSQRKRRGEPG